MNLFYTTWKNASYHTKVGQRRARMMKPNKKQADDDTASGIWTKSETIDIEHGIS